MSTGNEPVVASAAPLNPDLAGYPTVEALAAGYRSSSNEGKAQRDRADKLEAAVVQLLSGQANGNRSDVPNRMSATPEDELTKYGVPVNPLLQFIDQRITQAFQPLANGARARGEMVQSHPDYVKFETDVANFIDTDPALKAAYPKMFEVDPVGAMEYAFLKFGDSRRRTAPAPNGVASDAVNAQIPSSRVGEGRRAPDGSQELQTAFEAWQRTGTRQAAEAYARLRLHGVVKDEFLNQ